MGELDGGLAVEAGVDFTGGIPEAISLDAQTSEKEKRLFYTLKGVSQHDERFLSSSLEGRSGMGLEARHAYSITGFFELKLEHQDGKRVRLVRVRNPHGNEDEWKGAWGDKDEKHWGLISKEDKNRLNIVKKSDGEFFMAFGDFLRYFGELEVVHVRPDSMVVEGGMTKRWDVFHFSNGWEGETAGGCGNDSIDSFLKNPHFIFDLEDPDPRDREPECSAIVSLAQKPKDRKEARPIGFRVYRVESGSYKDIEKSVKYSEPIAKTDRYINMREVSLRMSVPPGKYVIIASTFRRRDEGEFLLRLFLTRGWGSSEQSGRRTARSGLGYQ